ncbi:branched-chain amino acid ABC transporter permease [Devosia sp. SL43]|uniref:branched-chain amino acid ABC transporter permease n=1 Tax=Devosia sp. SL43 TaxID=2806348 RepID=UPI001F2D4F6D|nr:branched-chain amino acid ABC transporter permease [Devosia sp. SL43]UJW84220.1 branched-chain amino acid ABC transporter permease [Devosia sp. SL43]
MTTYGVERWTRSGRLTVGAAAAVLVVLALLPTLASGLVIDKLTTLFIYILLAVMWNLLAGYAGLVSVGQQAFFGVGGYLALRLVDAGMTPYLALVIGAVGAGLVAIPISTFALRLKGGEFAIGMWVIAEVLRIVVMFDPLVQGETGTSLLALNAFDPELRRNLTYWLGLGSMALMLSATLWLLRSRIGAAAQAIRDDEEAAASIGIDVMRIKQIIFVLAAFGCALAGAIWLASAITFLPRTNFGVQWTVFMLFMVLVGGLKTFEGPIIGAVIFFLLQEIFGDLGVWYLTGLGVIAVGFALYLPDGLWGTWRQRTGIDLLSGGVMLKQPTKAPLP